MQHHYDFEATFDVTRAGFERALMFAAQFGPRTRRRWGATYSCVSFALEGLREAGVRALPDGIRTLTLPLSQGDATAAYSGLLAEQLVVRGIGYYIDNKSGGCRCAAEEGAMKRRWTRLMAPALCWLVWGCGQTPEEAISIACNSRETIPPGYQDRMFGQAVWVHEQVTNEEIEPEILRVFGAIDDPSERIRAIESLMERHGVRECHELELRRESLEEDQEAYEESSGPTLRKDRPDRFGLSRLMRRDACHSFWFAV